MCAIREFNLQVSTNTVWAYAAQEAHVVESLEAVQRGTVCKIRESSPQRLAITMRAFANLEVHDIMLLKAFRRGAICKIWELLEAVR